MSVQSLQNGSLQLRELTVSNAYDSLATGYVAESTTITPQSINTGAGSLITNNLTVGSGLTITNGLGNPNNVVLSCSSNNVFNVAGTVQADAVETTSLVLQSAGNPDTTISNISGIISTNFPIATNSTVTAPYFNGGIVSYVAGISLTIAAGQQSPEQTIILDGSTQFPATSKAWFFQLAANSSTATVSEYGISQDQTTGQITINYWIANWGTNSIEVVLVNVLGVAINATAA